MYHIPVKPPQAVSDMDKFMYAATCPYNDYSLWLWRTKPTPNWQSSLDVHNIVVNWSNLKCNTQKLRQCITYVFNPSSITDLIFSEQYNKKHLSRYIDAIKVNWFDYYIGHNWYCTIGQLFQMILPQSQKISLIPFWESSTLKVGKIVESPENEFRKSTS